MKHAWVDAARGRSGPCTGNMGTEAWVPEGVRSDTSLQLRNSTDSVTVAKFLPETKFPNLRTEAHGSGLDMKFGCYIIILHRESRYLMNTADFPESGVDTNQQQ
jgi:hypothetical protein